MTTLFPFWADWSAPVVESISYLTEVLSSRDGTEQRRALRNLPRRSLAFSIWTREDGFRAFQRRVVENLNDDFALADELRRTTLASTAAQGSTSVTVSAVPDWLEVGADVVVTSARRDAGLRDRSLHTVSGIAGSVVTFSPPLSNEAPAGSDLRPALSARLVQPTAARLLTNSFARRDLTFEIVPGSEPAPEAGSAATTFNGREVLTLRPDWSAPLEIEDAHSGETVDFATGLSERFQTGAFAASTVRASYLLRTPEDRAALIGLFHRTKGRRGSFYVASGSPDLVLSAAVASGSSTWRFAGQDAAAAYADHPVYRAIEVRLRDGSVLRFRVETMVADGDETVLTTIETTPFGLSVEDVRSVSWLTVRRFASDEMAVEWTTANLARVNVGLLTLEDA